jgi:hypothetical protein
LLLEAELLSGSAPGVKAIVARGGTPGAGDAALDDTGQVAFASADVGASAETVRVKYVAVPGSGTATDGLGTRLASDLQT